METSVHACLGVRMCVQCMCGGLKLVSIVLGHSTFFIFKIHHLCACVHMPLGDCCPVYATEYMWRAEDNMQELILSYHLSWDLGM